MLSDTPLITTIIAGLCLAFVFGVIAHRLKISPIVGYLLAGIAVGPYTGGFHADPKLTHELSEIGVILLMFGVGLHFSLKDLLSVKFIAVPGAILQIAGATILGAGLAWLLGGNLLTNIIFGLSLSTASTVVLIRNMQGFNLLETERGRIAIGWLIVEDMVMVLLLVLIPALMHSSQPSSPILEKIFGTETLSIWQILTLTSLKMLIFLASMLVIGRRLIPWILQLTAQSGSRELFRLGILAITLGVAAGSAYLFGVSLALGAFFAGLVMGETEFSQRAAEESLPLRDAFAVLFFVSVGMIFNPFAIWDNFFGLLGALFIIMIGKGIIAYFLMRLAKKTVGTALTISASLAQIGEFSFILVGLGATFGILNENLRDIIVGSAMVSILLNPFMFILADKLQSWLEKKEFTASDNLDEIVREQTITPCSCENHIIFIGYSPLTIKIVQELNKQNIQTVIIDQDLSVSSHLDEIQFLRGDASSEKVLKAANIDKAQKIVLILPNAFEASNIVHTIKKIQPNVPIVAYSRTEQETEFLIALGLDYIINHDDEIGKSILDLLAYDKNVFSYKSNIQPNQLEQKRDFLSISTNYSTSDIKREEE